MEQIRQNKMITVTESPKKELIGTLCFYVFWFIQMICKGLGMGSESKPYLLLSLVSLAFLGVKYLLTDWTYREFMLSCCILFVTVLSYLLTDMMVILLLGVTICGGKGIDLKKLFLYTFYVRSILFVGMVGASVFGFDSTPYSGTRYRVFEVFRAIEKFITIYLIGGNHSLSAITSGNYFRYDLGFGEPNVAHINLLLIVLIYIYIRNNRLTVWEYVGIVLANYILYYWTFSRTSLYIILGVLVATLVLRVCVFKKIFYAVGSFAFFACLVLSVVLAYTFDPAPYVGEATTWQWICSKLDKLFTSRLNLSATAANAFPCYYIFGSRFRTGWNMLDSAYMNFWLRFGFVSCVMVLMMYTERMEQCKREDDVSLFLMLFVMALFGFTEMSFYAITSNVFLFALKDVIFEKPYRVYPEPSYFKTLIKRRKP